MKKEDKHEDFVHTYKWYAWRPVKTESGLNWFKYVSRTDDARPLQCQVLPTITRFSDLK